MSYPMVNEHLIEIKAGNHHLALPSKQAPLLVSPALLPLPVPIACSYPPDDHTSLPSCVS